MIFKPVLIEKILSGEKTVTRRPVKMRGEQCHYEVGKIYAIQPGMARVSVGRVRVITAAPVLLDPITDDEAHLEGFPDANAFKLYWINLYGNLKAPEGVWRIEFELVEQTHAICTCCDGAGTQLLETKP